MAKLSFFLFLTVFSVAVASSLPINFDFNLDGTQDKETFFSYCTSSARMMSILAWSALE